MSDTESTVPSGSRSKRSWIWQHFKEEEIEENGIKISILKCQEKDDDGNICKVSYKSCGSSTGNAIQHLRTIHNITNNSNISNIETKEVIYKVNKVNKINLNIFINFVKL
jgi:hypothetical protein